MQSVDPSNPTDSKSSPTPAGPTRSFSQRTQPLACEDALDQPQAVDVLRPIEDAVETAKLANDEKRVLALAAEPARDEKAPLSPVEKGNKSIGHTPSAALVPAPYTNGSTLSALFERLKLHHTQQRARCAAKHAACVELCRAHKLEREARREKRRMEWEQNGRGVAAGRGRLR